MVRLIMNKKIQGSRGQVVLMVLLASALVLVLGLSAAKQATVETNIDTDQELLKKAFNAAESGIEYYIKTGESEYENLEYEGKSVLLTQPLGNNQILSFNKKTGPGDVEIFWLVDHLDNGDIGTSYYSKQDNTIDICSTTQSGAVNFKVDYFYKTGTEYKVQRVFGANPWVTTNGALLPNNCANVTLQGNSIFIAVTPVEISTIINVKGAVNFPVQGEKILATGSVGKVNNLVTIDHPYKLLNTFLLEAVVSEGVVTNQ